MNEIAYMWFEESKKLEVGEALFIRVADKKEQTALANVLHEEKSIYALINPVHASQLFINKVLKERKQYVTIERKYRAPFVAFFKDSQGAFSKREVDPDRYRILKLMLKDRKSKDEIEAVLNGLTEEEIALYFPEENNIA